MALTSADIVQAALDQLDEGGIDSVTVRAVAKRLGVQAPALYWHVRNKQALLDAMGTEIQRRILVDTGNQQPADANWRDRLRAYAQAIRREYLAHRDGARTFSGTRLTDPEVLRARESDLRAWVDQGFSVAQAVTAHELVVSFVSGFVIEEQERADDQRYSLSERAELIGSEHPLMIEAGELQFTDPEGRFSTQLEILLAGVEATH